MEVEILFYCFYEKPFDSAQADKAIKRLKRTAGAMVINLSIVVLHKTKKAPVLQLMLS